MSKKFIKLNQKIIQKLFNLNNSFHEKIMLAVKYIKNCSRYGGKLIILGNGGSSAIASHAAADFSKNAGIRAICFSDASLITCLSNDYSFNEWMKKALELYSDNEDLVILISSSGNSQNIINAGKYCKKKKLKVITLSGMHINNKLKKLNKNDINFWVNSFAYNHIELIHLYILLLMVDVIIGKTIYKIK